MTIGVYGDEESDLRLTSAFLIYSNELEAACTFHRVDLDKKGRPVIAEGTPANRGSIIELANKLQGTSFGKTEILPPNLLVMKPGLMCWYVPSRRARMYFETNDKTFNADLTGREVLHPATLFVAARQLKVFALSTNDRPTMETPIFIAPYFNLYSSGSMCAGNQQLPTAFSPSEIPAWETAFYETNFSHTNMNQSDLTGHPHGHNALWREMAKTRLKQFPANYLLPSTDSAGRQLTLQEALSDGQNN
jgi:PRTRC genetic system protein B